MFTLQTIFKLLLPRGRAKESNPLVGEEKCTGEKQRRGRVHDVWGRAEERRSVVLRSREAEKSTWCVGGAEERRNFTGEKQRKENVHDM